MLSKQAQNHEPDYIYKCLYRTVFVTVFVTTAQFDGMNNILLVRLKNSTLFTIKIQNLIIKSGVTLLCKNLYYISY